MDLQNQIAQLAGVSSHDAGQLLVISKYQKLTKGSLFIRAGEKPQKLGIVLKGLFRYLYTDTEGNEYTKSFMPETSFLSSYSSMIRKEPSYYDIEALEDSEILEFAYEDWCALKDSSPAWKDLLIQMLERGYGAKERRERDLLLLDAETRYRNFCNEFPHLITRVKQHQIASFLGIKPESLSRIRKKIVGLP